jgi:plastocyanin
MKLRLASLVTLCFGLLILAVPASAGGFASVHVDSSPNEIFVDSPVTFTFHVLQHDVTPINLDHVYFESVNRETLDDLKVEAAQEGDVGHYSVDVNFPSAGSWKSVITIEPFEGTSLPTLNVLPAGGASLSPNAFPEPQAHPVAIHVGTCEQLAEPEHDLNETGPLTDKEDGAEADAAWVGSETAKVVGISESMLPISLSDLVDAPNAIAIHKSDNPGDGNVACGDIGGATTGDMLIVGLDEVDNSDDVGIAVLESEGDQTKVTIYTFISSGAPVADSPESAGKVVEINILAMADGEWMFEPASVTIPVGTTVKWTNATDIGHTIQSGDINFEDSGLVPSGGSFTETFDRPGTYFYTCGPHPWMTGTITVE